MRALPSRLRRLDGALADLPLEDPMLLTELDGFLTGVLVCPEPIASVEWMQCIWGSDDSGVAPFEDPIDVQWFADAVAARYREIARDLARGRLQPIFDIDERNGDVLWEMWVDGFEEAMTLRPEAWERHVDAEASARLALLIAVAHNDSSLDSIEINAFVDRAPAEIAELVQRLYTKPEAAAPPAVKVGRNEPCPCGSGKKSKRCCL